MTLSLSVMVFFMIAFKLCIIGKKPTKVMCLYQCLSGVHNAKSPFWQD